VTRARRRPAGRPAPRTVDVTVAAGEFAGWSCTARADFPARVLADLQSGSIDRIMVALDVIIVDHNFPGADGELAETMADVDPYRGLLAVAGDALDAIGKLPNR